MLGLRVSAFCRVSGFGLRVFRGSSMKQLIAPQALMLCGPLLATRRLPRVSHIRRDERTLHMGTAWCKRAHRVLRWCTHGALMVYLWCTYGVPVVYLWCTDRVRMVYLLCTDGVLMVYIATYKPLAWEGIAVLKPPRSRLQASLDPSEAVMPVCRNFGRKPRLIR